jgi:hypothetical protein
VIVAPETRAGGVTGADLVADAVERTPVPV